MIIIDLNNDKFQTVNVSFLQRNNSIFANKLPKMKSFSDDQTYWNTDIIVL